MSLAERFAVLELLSCEFTPSSVVATLTIDEPCEERAFRVVVEYAYFSEDTHVCVDAWWGLDLAEQPITSANRAVVHALALYVDANDRLTDDLHARFRQHNVEMVACL